jgi:hypothetical protein
LFRVGRQSYKTGIKEKQAWYNHPSGKKEFGLVSDWNGCWGFGREGMKGYKEAERQDVLAII